MSTNGLREIELPVIDVTQTDEDTAKRLIDAVATHGFVYLKNNHEEIPPSDIGEMFDLVCSTTVRIPLFPSLQSLVSRILQNFD